MLVIAVAREAFSAGEREEAVRWKSQTGMMV